MIEMTSGDEFPKEQYHDEEEEEYHDEVVGENVARRRRKKAKQTVTGKKRRIPCMAWIMLLVAIVFVGLGVYGSYLIRQQQDEESSTVAESNNNNSGAAASSSRTSGGETTTKESSQEVEGSSVVEEEELPEEPLEKETPVESSEAAAINTPKESEDVITLTENKKLQMENFQDQNGILFNFHITHHGGTSVCGEMRKGLTAPSKGCSHPKEVDVGDDYPNYFPWTHDDTAKNVAKIQQYFNFVQWEIRGGNRHPNVADVDWENPHLLSMLVIREPLSRALAGDGFMHDRHPTIFTGHASNENATLEEWWDFAHEEVHNNNYALRALSREKGCCNGSSTDCHYLDEAKELVERFTFVLDIDCLEHGLEELGNLLGFEISHTHQDGPHAPAKDLIPFPEVYDYLVEKNKLDIELYEWAKTFALVNCDDVLSQEGEGDERLLQRRRRQRR